MALIPSDILEHHLFKLIIDEPSCIVACSLASNRFHKILNRIAPAPKTPREKVKILHAILENIFKVGSPNWFTITLGYPKLFVIRSLSSSLLCHLLCIAAKGIKPGYHVVFSDISMFKPEINLFFN